MGTYVNKPTHAKYWENARREDSLNNNFRRVLAMPHCGMNVSPESGGDGV